MQRRASAWLPEYDRNEWEVYAASHPRPVGHVLLIRIIADPDIHLHALSRRVICPDGFGAAGVGSAKRADVISLGGPGGLGTHPSPHRHKEYEFFTPPGLMVARGT